MQKGVGSGGVAAAPTGCFKCGRPGHWSRDCPSSAPPNTNTNSHPNSGSFPSKLNQGSTKAAPENPNTPAAAKKAPRTRPKLTPELLLSDDGLGYVLRHFPKSFKYHGRGHEVKDLGNLISMYAEWHKHLISYYSFDQFIRKVEQVGATRRVRMCLRELRERVANGGDPTKLHEPPTEHVDVDREAEMVDAEIPVPDAEDPPLGSHVVDDLQEEMFNEIYQKAIEETPQPMQEEVSQVLQSTNLPSLNPEHLLPDNTPGQESSISSSSKIQITGEQRARMEANRLKALERAAARARALQAPAS